MFKLFKNIVYPLMRDPNFQPKCYDMTEEERAQAILHNNRNVWNTPELAKQDRELIC